MQPLRRAPKLGREQRLGEDEADCGRQIARDGQREHGQDGQRLREISTDLSPSATPPHGREGKRGVRSLTSAFKNTIPRCKWSRLSVDGPQAAATDTATMLLYNRSRERPLTPQRYHMSHYSLGLDKNTVTYDMEAESRRGNTPQANCLLVREIGK